MKIETTVFWTVIPKLFFWNLSLPMFFILNLQTQKGLSLIGKKAYFKWLYVRKKQNFVKYKYFPYECVAFVFIKNCLVFYYWRISYESKLEIRSSRRKMF